MVDTQQLGCKLRKFLKDKKDVMSFKSGLSKLWSEFWKKTWVQVGSSQV